MRKFVTIVCATAAIAASAQEIETKPFCKTYIDVPARVRFVKGNEYSVRVNTNDKEMASNIQCTLKDGVLSFEYKGLNAKSNTEVEPGKSVFDAKSGSYFYGIDIMDNMLHGDSKEGSELVITVTSPEKPVFTTSKSMEAMPYNKKRSRKA